MRPYFTGNAKVRLAKMKPENRRRVIAFARYQALDKGTSLDIDRHLFAVTEHHLKLCGYPKSKHKRRKAVVQDHQRSPLHGCAGDALDHDGY